MNPDQYNQDEKKELLKIARTTLKHKILEEKIYQPQMSNPKFLQKRGVFVTLHLNGQLRGCIGNIEPVKPLIEAVRDNAIACAVEDPRFFPLTRNELAEVDIEISILTKPVPKTLDEIQPNIDGVILSKDGFTATFLPQVWQELSKKEDFLSHLCQKAGLEANAWQDSDCQFSCYQAIAFGEK